MHPFPLASFQTVCVDCGCMRARDVNENELRWMEKDMAQEMRNAINIEMH